MPMFVQYWRIANSYMLGQYWMPVLPIMTKLNNYIAEIAHNINGTNTLIQFSFASNVSASVHEIKNILRSNKQNKQINK